MIVGPHSRSYHNHGIPSLINSAYLLSFKELDFGVFVFGVHVL